MSESISGLPELVTYARASRVLDQILAKFGEDYVYVNRYGEQADPDTRPSCFYVHGDGATRPKEPGCIIGQLLHRLGVPLDSFSLLEGEAADSVVKKFFPRTSGAVLTFLRDVQHWQDGGRSWGAAVSFAREMYASETYRKADLGE